MQKQKLKNKKTNYPQGRGITPRPLNICIMSVQEAKDLLRANGYFTDNLWSIQDVQMRYKCDDETAQDILNQALTNGSVMEHIHEAIQMICEEEQLEEVED